jgi:hypothetical protein
MTTLSQNVGDETFIEEWKRQWLVGSFLAYISRGSEPIGNIVGKIKCGLQWGISHSEMQRLLDEALTKAYRPDHARHEEIEQHLRK